MHTNSIIIHCCDCRTCIACFIISLCGKENIIFTNHLHNYFLEPESGVIPHGDSLLLSLIIGIVVVILVAMALLAILGLAFVVCLIRRLVFITRKLNTC